MRRFCATTAIRPPRNLYSAKLGGSHIVKDSFIPTDENRLGFDNFFAAYDYHHSYFAPGAHYHTDSEEYLFDNRTDPLQMHNLASEADAKNLLRTLKNEMFAKMAMIGDDFEPNDFYKKNWVTGRVIRPVLPKRKDPGAKR